MEEKSFRAYTLKECSIDRGRKDYKNEEKPGRSALNTDRKKGKRLKKGLTRK